MAPPGEMRPSLMAGLMARTTLIDSPLDAFQVEVMGCRGEGDCVETCSVRVFERDEEGRCAVVNDFLCYGCMACVAQCLDGGVRITSRARPRYSRVDELLR